MRYCGGKGRIGRKIAAILNPIIRERGLKAYWEPFVGACGVMRHIEAPVRIGTDIDPDIIGLWQALQAGWLPPSEVTEEDYHRIKADPESVDVATRAFVAWGCSFGGRKWEGFARGGYSYADTAKRALLKILPLVQDVGFSVGSYRMFWPEGPTLVYCDPPYVSTEAGSAAFKGFDHAHFWDWAGRLAKEGHAVFVSEYTGPPGWESAEVSTKLSTLSAGRNGSGDLRTERLFYRLGD